MTGKVLVNNTSGLLILIIPLAFVIVILYSAWPLLIALTVLAIALNVWQRYQWKQWSQKINPFFNELITENQGCITAMDLSVKANLSGQAARQFLEKKAEEYGAQRKKYQDKGIVYYFLTASALGTIFADSEPIWEIDSEGNESVATENRQLPEPHLAATEPENPNTNLPLVNSHPDKSVTLIQGELAQRLNVHTATVGKRKLNPDFPEWTRKKDPDDIAWQYLPEEKTFAPLVTAN